MSRTAAAPDVDVLEPEAKPRRRQSAGILRAIARKPERIILIDRKDHREERHRSNRGSSCATWCGDARSGGQRRLGKRGPESQTVDSFFEGVQ